MRTWLPFRFGGKVVMKFKHNTVESVEMGVLEMEALAFESFGLAIFH